MRLHPAALALALVTMLLPCPAAAIPVFAHRYAVSCQKCHSIVPRLNAFGREFMAHGDRLPGVTAGPAFGVSAKVNLAYTSEPSPEGLPKLLVDEIELLAAGTLGERANYFLEQYVVDGGNRGQIRDAWIARRFTADTARTPIWLQAGSLTLPLPVDPETFRETAQHYAIFDQRVGADAFAFFKPKVGAQLTVGDVSHAASFKIFGGPRYDGSAGGSAGTDAMALVQEAMGGWTLATYAYGGMDGGGSADRSTRRGLSVAYSGNRWSGETLWQTGWDSAANGAGAASSGGFAQIRYQAGPRLFGLVRYEGTDDPSGFLRRAIVLAGFRPARNARITIEDAISRTSSTSNALTLQFTAAY